MVDESIVMVVRRYLRSLVSHGVVTRAGVVFGSSVRGEAHEWSDIDLLVLSPRFDGRVSLQDVELLWLVAGRTDSRIEPIPCGERQWEEDDASVIVEVARREGQRISLEEGDVRSPEAVH